MKWLERFLVRRPRSADCGSVPAWARPRLRNACRSLSEEEADMQRLLHLPVRPSLTLADEELGVLIDAEGRRSIEGDDAGDQ